MNADFFKKQILGNQFIRGSFSTVCAKFGSLGLSQLQLQTKPWKKRGEKDFVLYEEKRSASKLYAGKDA